MTQLLLSMPGNEPAADALCAVMGREPWERAAASFRQFPDGESYVRVDTPVRDREMAILCTLDRPDDKILPLIFAAATARDLGAARVGLIAPYLAYMRQDRRFVDGEGVTSTYFADLLSHAVDWLVTVDPHLHRRSSLSEIYRIPTRVVHAADHLARWIRAEVRDPLLVGPDSESAQWVSAVARAADAPFIVAEKTRHGDRDVSVELPDVELWPTRTPVLIDDIVSTARTMIETVGLLRRARMRDPVCLAVHGVFAAGAYEALRAAGAARIATCNTIAHASNAIDLSPDLAHALLTLTRVSGHATATVSGDTHE